ncbi:DUF3500 domain-containing protein [Streptomyces umbrinus]
MQQQCGGGSAAASLVLTAVNTFLGTLSSSQKAAVQVPAPRANLSKWSNLPDALYARAGLRMDSLTSAQRTAVLNILAAALSPAGFEQVTGITYGDGVLKEQGGIDLDFGADHYWIRILGTPSATGKCTIQYGGHHLAARPPALSSRPGARRGRGRRPPSRRDAVPISLHGRAVGRPCETE